MIITNSCFDFLDLLLSFCHELSLILGDGRLSDHQHLIVALLVVASIHYVPLPTKVTSLCILACLYPYPHAGSCSFFDKCPFVICFLNQSSTVIVYIYIYLGQLSSLANVRCWILLSQLWPCCQFTCTMTVMLKFTWWRPALLHSILL